MMDPRTRRLRAAILPWTNSYSFVVLLALLIGVFAILASYGFDWMLHDMLRPFYASDLLEGAVAAALSGAALLKLQKRRRELLVRMQIVEDVNHHVRNALTAVVLSASLREDAELNALVRNACERIDWVLNDVLPQSIEASDIEAAMPRWTAGRQLESTYTPGPSPGTRNL